VTTEKGSSGFWDIEGVEELQLFRGDCRKAVEGALANFGRMALDAFKQIECGARACAVIRDDVHDIRARVAALEIEIAKIDQVNVVSSSRL
jgi:hypothetical protein